MNVFVEKYILISGFLSFLEVKVFGKVLICVISSDIISDLDGQSKFQMLTLFSLEIHQHGGSIPRVWMGVPRKH